MCLMPRPGISHVALRTQSHGLRVKNSFVERDQIAKEFPQPQEEVAFGFRMAKDEPTSSST